MPEWVLRRILRSSKKKWVILERIPREILRKSIHSKSSEKKGYLSLNLLMIYFILPMAIGKNKKKTSVNYDWDSHFNAITVPVEKSQRSWDIWEIISGGIWRSSWKNFYGSYRNISGKIVEVFLDKSFEKFVEKSLEQFHVELLE